MNKTSNITAALKLINQSTKITLLTHRKPDGDAVSACAALEYVLCANNKKIETVYPDSPEFPFKRQPINLYIAEHSQVPDLIISVDAANYDRLYYPKAFASIPLINIDHHMSNSINGSFNFVNPEASSACEVLMTLLRAWDSVSIGKFVIDKNLAEILLFGILYDSQVFHTQLTHATTLRMAADLIDLGADLFKLKCELLANKDPKILGVWRLLLDRIEISKKKNAVSTYLLQSDLNTLGVTITSLVGFNDFLASISDIDITILFYETGDGKTKVSLRSRKADVNALAAKFGGGGHKNASGILSDMKIKDLMESIFEAL